MVFRDSRNSIKMHSSASQKTVPIIFLADGIVFGFFFCWWIQMMPFHTLPLPFGVEMMKPAFIACHNTEQKIISFVSISPKHFWSDGFSLNFYGLQSVNAVPNGHKFSNNLSFQSSPELHCDLFLVLLQLHPASHVCLRNNFISSLVGFCWGCLRATTMRLILDACVPIFKMLYPSSNTTSTHLHTHAEVCGEYQQRESLL